MLFSRTNRAVKPAKLSKLQAAVAPLMERLEGRQLFTVLLGWDTSTQTATAQSTPLVHTTIDAGVTTPVEITRGSGIAAAGAGAAYGSNSFDTTVTTLAGAVAANEYYTFGFTVASGKQVSLTSIPAFNIRRSGTGPTTYQFQYSINGGTFTSIGGPTTIGSTTTSAGNAQAAVSLSGITALQGLAAGTQVTFRQVLWGATGSGGTEYFNDPPTASTDIDFEVDGNVSNSAVSTTTALTSISPTTVTAGSNVTFTGTVTAASGTTIPTGTIEIRNGGAAGTLLASTTTIGGSGANGTFSINTTSIPAGTYSNLQAFYVAGTGFTNSNSSVSGTTLTVTSLAPTTTTALSSISPSTITAGQNTTFAGTVVAASGTATPAGTIEIRNGGAAGTLLASTTTIGGSGVNGTYSISTTSIPAGTYSSIQAFYVPGGNNFQSSSSAVSGTTLTVQSAPVITSANSKTITVGIADTFQVVATGVPSPTTYSLSNFSGGASAAWISIDSAGLITFASNGSRPTVTSATPYTFDITVSNGVAPDATQTFTVTDDVPRGQVTYSGGTYSNNFDWLGTTDPVTQVTGAGPYRFDGSNSSPSQVNFGSTSGSNSTNGWQYYKYAGTGADAVFFTNDGNTPNQSGQFYSGGLYSLGVTGSNERALGSIGSNATSITYGVKIVNGTGLTQTSFKAAFDEEFYRVGGTAAELVDFQWSTSAASIDAASGWVDANAGDLTTTTVGTPVAKSVTVDSGFSWAPGSALFLRWRDNNASGTDDMLGIDNFTFTSPAPASPTITSANSARIDEGAASTFQVTATGSPTSYTLTGAPSWASINNTGLITFSTTGRPAISTATDYSFTVTASNGNAPDATQSFTVTDRPGAIEYTTAGAAYTQSFDRLTSVFAETPLFGATGITTPTDPTKLEQSPYINTGVSGPSLEGWQYSSISGTTQRFTASNGTTNAGGGAYDFGASGDTDRSLGAFSSSTGVARFGASFVNNTGATLTQASISYMLELWSRGTNTSDKLDFSYAIGASGLNDDLSFTDVDSLDAVTPKLAAPVGPLDGNFPDNRAAVSGTISGISWGAGQVLYIRWSDTSTGGTQDGLAVDDLSFSASASSTLTPTAPSSVVASKNSASNTQVDLTWVDNSPGLEQEDGFTIERSTDGSNFSPIFTTAADATAYSDTSASAGTLYYYRVTASNSAGSAASNVSSVTTLPSWVVPGAEAGYNAATQTLTVTGIATINADPTAGSAVNVDGGTLSIDPAGGTVVHLAGLNLSNGATASVVSVEASVTTQQTVRDAVNHRTLVVNATFFTVDSSSKLDLGDNDMILKNASAGSANSGVYSDVQGLVQSGLTSGVNAYWDGFGINSSAAANDGNFRTGLGVASVFDLGIGGSAFNGELVADEDVVIKYTYYGDCNLDGVVDLNNDFSIFQDGVNGNLPAGWLAGDFNYDGVVDVNNDFSIFQDTFNNQGPAL